MKLANWVVQISAIVFTASFVQAAEYYPRVVPSRLFGSNQANIDSCQAEAEVTALEHVFARLGYPVRLSLHHRHAKIWQGRTSEAPAGVNLGLVYTTLDHSILNQAGALIPDYMWPEDGLGLNSFELGKIRPNASNAAAIHLSWPKAESMGFREEYYSLKPGYSNTRGFDHLKAYVAQGHAVALTMHARFLERSSDYFNRVTGLMRTPYSSERFSTLFTKPTDHSVAVVGFDDALASFIIRNTWNDVDEVEMTKQTRLSPQEISDLAKMRLKIAPRILPGYYALPYQYVQDLVGRGQGGFKVLLLNYAAFAEAYQHFKGLYKIKRLPFSCNAQIARWRVGDFKQNMPTLKSSNPSMRKEAHEKLVKFAKLFFSQALLIVSILPSPARSAVIQNTDDTQLRLGYGVDPDIERVFDSCLEFDPSQVESEDNVERSKSLKVSSKIITSSREADELMHVSASASASYLMINGNVSYSQETRSYSDSDRVSVGVKADADYGRWYLKNIRLKPEMKALAARDIKAFYRRCGHEYVSGYRAGQGIAILMTASNEASYSFSHIQSSAHAGLQAANGSGEIGGTFLSVASELIKLGTLEVRLRAYGGGELHSIKEFLRSTKDVIEFSKIISDYVGGLKKNQSTRTHYITSPYPIPNQPFMDLLYAHRRETILDMHAMYRDFSIEVRRLRQALSSNFLAHNQVMCTQKGMMTCTQYLSYLSNIIKARESALGAIGEAAQKCADAEKFDECKTPNIWHLFPELARPVTWPAQYRRMLYEAYVQSMKNDKNWKP